MAITKLPQANLFSQQYTDAQLINRTQLIHDKLGVAPGLTNFPTPPVTLADYQDLIDAYQSATVDAIKGTKVQTDAKNLAKKNLILATKELQQYVNSTVYTSWNNGSIVSIENARVLISTSGFFVSTLPKPQANNSGIDLPIVRKAISNNPASVYILVRQKQKRKRVVINTKQGRKLWNIRYRLSAIGTTPAGPWILSTSTTSNINITGLDDFSGKSIDFQVAAIGGRDIKRNTNNPVNYTPIQSLIVT